MERGHRQQTNALWTGASRNNISAAVHISSLLLCAGCYFNYRRGIDSEHAALTMSDIASLIKAMAAVAEAKPVKAVDATIVAGRMCSACQQSRSKVDYSKQQYEKAATKRKCKSCQERESGQHSIAFDHPHAIAAAKFQAAISVKAAPSTIAMKLTKKQFDVNDSSRLISDDGEFHPAAEAAFLEIFTRFDVDRDGAWSDSEVQSFAMCTNYREFDVEEMIELKQNFICNEHGALTQQGFLDLFFMQSTSECAETFKDLMRLGYNDELKLEGAASTVEAITTATATAGIAAVAAATTEAEAAAETA